MVLDNVLTLRPILCPAPGCPYHGKLLLTAGMRHLGERLIKAHCPSHFFLTTLSSTLTSTLSKVAVHYPAHGLTLHGQDVVTLSPDFVAETVKCLHVGVTIHATHLVITMRLK